jgi:sugar lactone lactonase YvrE
MLAYLSSIVALAAIWLALETFPHTLPVKAPFTPRPAPLSGEWEPNDELSKTGVFIAKDKILCAETVFVKDKDNCDQVFAPDSRGRIWSLPAPGSLDQNPGIIAHVGGSLLGGAFDRHGNIYVADATRGLLMVPNSTVVSQRGSARIVSTMAPSDVELAVSENSLDMTEIRYADDLVVDPATDFVYFTDATHVAPTVGTSRKADTLNSFITAHLSGDATGRVLCYVPRTGATYVLATGIHFANGIGLSRDGSHLIVASTSSYVLYKIPTPSRDVDWGSLPAPLLASELDLFYEHSLPGFADGLTVDENGHVWVAINAPVPAVGLLADVAPAWLRHILVRAPYSLRPGSGSLHSILAEFSSDGKLLRVLQDKSQNFGILSSVERCGTFIYSGSLNGRHVARFTVG